MEQIITNETMLHLVDCTKLNEVKTFKSTTNFEEILSLIVNANFDYIFAGIKGEYVLLKL